MSDGGGGGGILSIIMRLLSIMVTFFEHKAQTLAASGKHWLCRPWERDFERASGHSPSDLPRMTLCSGETIL